MPLQEFWYDDPDLLWAYRNVYIEREKQNIQVQKQMINYQAWLQGLYNFKAITGALSKTPTYLNSPIDLEVNHKTEKEKKVEIANKVKENAIKGRKILEQRRRTCKD